MTKISSGILVYKRSENEIYLLLLHLGGPLWSNKDSWTIPKGEAVDHEDDIIAAKREFEEEVGLSAPQGEFIDLGLLRQSSAKTNHIFAVEGDIDTSLFKCNEFEMEWPPHSGKIQRFPECDKAEWFSLEEAKTKILAAQVEFIDILMQKIANI